jgi:hypothetical protein
LDFIFKRPFWKIVSINYVTLFFAHFFTAPPPSSHYVITNDDPSPQKRKLYATKRDLKHPFLKNQFVKSIEKIFILNLF